MNTVASLPMYDFPEIRWATDALWQGIARHLRRHGVDGIPSRLVHDVPLNRQPCLEEQPQYAMDFAHG